MSFDEAELIFGIRKYAVGIVPETSVTLGAQEPCEKRTFIQESKANNTFRICIAPRALMRGGQFTFWPESYFT
jgi:hypothetical protein